MTTYLLLKQQAEELLEQAEVARKAEVTAVVEDMKKKIKEYGISAKELGFSIVDQGNAGSKKDKLPAKYKGPNGELWSGRGRKPQWLQDALDKGQSLDQFLVC